MGVKPPARATAPLTPRTLMTAAAGFQDAAVALTGRPMFDGRLHYPALVVNLCFAVELGLKTFILFHGGDEKLLRRIRHDLSQALDEAVLRGYQVPHQDVADLVAILSPLHATSRLRYLRSENLTIPDELQAVCIVGGLLHHLAAQLPLNDLWQPMDGGE